MGFITNQWINRGYGVSKPKTRARAGQHLSSGKWSQQRQVKVKFTARDSDGKRQILYLSQDEVDAAGAVVIDAMSAKGRRRLWATLRLSRFRVPEHEADIIGETVVSTMSTKGRERLLAKFLRLLTHAKLLRVLAFDLRERVRLPKR
jgi:hypothetical protein